MSESLTTKAIDSVKSALLEVQEYVRLSGDTARGAFSRPFYAHDLVEQLEVIGLGSLTVVLLTGRPAGPPPMMMTSYMKSLSVNRYQLSVASYSLTAHEYPITDNSFSFMRSCPVLLPSGFQL